MYKRFITLMMASLFVSAQAQQCDSLLMASTPAQDIVIAEPGMVRDNKTGLTWMRCNIGQVWSNDDCTGIAELHTWEGALELANRYNDWRLPNIKELQTIVAFQCHEPAINLSLFPSASFDALSGRLWSSTPNANRASDAWLLHLRFGHDLAFEKKSLAAVKLVRD